MNLSTTTGQVPQNNSQKDLDDKVLNYQTYYKNEATSRWLLGENGNEK